MEIFYIVETMHFVSPDVTEDVWKLGNQWNPAKVKEQIIQNSIYGVDIEKGAVDIARLRFWLSLVVDEETPQPLPNLDYKIVAGNSLLSKFNGVVIDIDWNPKGVTDEKQKKLITEQQVKLHLLQQKQHLFFVSQHGNKQKLKEEIKNLKTDILINQVELTLNQYRKANSFITSIDLTAKEQLRNQQIKEQTALYVDTIEQLKALRKDSHEKLNFFDWKLDFPEVMNEKLNKEETGFDIVIGNPPYKMIQPNNTSRIELETIKSIYEVTNFKIDLFHLFFQLAYRIVKKEGELIYITPSTLLYNFYVEDLRNWLVSKFTIEKILVAKEMVFDADVHTAIYMFRKTMASENANVYITVELEKILLGSSKYKSIPHKKIGSLPGSVWNLLVTEENLPIIEKITGHPQLETIAKINRGLITGDRKKYFSPTKINNKYKPILAGSDIERYYSKEPTEYVLFEKPKTSGGCWDPEVHLSEFKLCIRQIGFRPTATIIERPYAVTGNIFTVSHENLKVLKQILGIISSKMIKYYWSIMFNDFKTSFPQVTIANLGQIPIILSDEKYSDKIFSNVDRILKLKAKESTANTTDLEEEIDIIIYKMYELSYSEVSLIEGNTDWMTKEQYENFSLEKSEIV